MKKLNIIIGVVSLIGIIYYLYVNHGVSNRKTYNLQDSKGMARFIDERERGFFVFKTGKNKVLLYVSAGEKQSNRGCNYDIYLGKSYNTIDTTVIVVKERENSNCIWEMIGEQKVNLSTEIKIRKKIVVENEKGERYDLLKINEKKLHQEYKKEQNYLDNYIKKVSIIAENIKDMTFNEKRNHILAKNYKEKVHLEFYKKTEKINAEDFEYIKKHLPKINRNVEVTIYYGKGKKREMNTWITLYQDENQQLNLCKASGYPYKDHCNKVGYKNSKD